VGCAATHKTPLEKRAAAGGEHFAPFGAKQKASTKNPRTQSDLCHFSITGISLILPPMKKYIGTILRLGITIVGLYYAAQQIDFAELGPMLVNSRWGWVFAGFMLVNISMFVRAWRWSLLLQGLGVTIKFGRLVELYFVGNFFNAFLPSGFGGDVVRVVEVAQDDVSVDVASGTVFLDRFTGLLVLFVMGLVALPLRPAEFPTNWALVIAIVCVCGLIGGGILLDGRLVRWFGKSPLGRFLPNALSPVGDGPIAKFLAAVSGCGWPAIWQAIGISVLFDVLLVLWWTAATYALEAPVAITYNLLVVPIQAIALLVPSVGGLGVRETLSPALYAGAGLDATTAVSVSLIVFIMLRASGLLGAPVYLYTIFTRQKETLESR